MHIKSEKAKKTTKHTLYLTLELTKTTKDQLTKHKRL